MKLGKSHSFKLIAIAAAREADVAIPEDGDMDKQAEAVARSEDGRDARAKAWALYENMLQDQRTYSLDSIKTWLKLNYKIDLGISSIHRDRKRLIAGEMRSKLASQRMKETLNALDGTEAGEMFKKGQKLVGHMILSNLVNYSTEALEDMKPSQIVAMMSEFIRLSKVQAETTILEQKIEIGRKLTAQVTAVAKKSRDGKLSESQIKNIVEAVLGSAA